MPTRKATDTCVCAGQEDLTELVGLEHIHGSRPADDAAFEAEREAFYQKLRDAIARQRPRDE
jgi:hypothetical protein